MRKVQTAKNIKFRSYRFKRSHALQAFARHGLGDLDIALARLNTAPLLVLDTR